MSVQVIPSLKVHFRGLFMKGEGNILVKKHEIHAHHCNPNGSKHGLASIVNHDPAVVPNKIHDEKTTAFIVLLPHF